MYSPGEPTINEFEEHQELLLPFTSLYLGRTNLDIGCGNGLTSVIHQEKLAVISTLCDIVDIRHSLARSLPFVLFGDGALPFSQASFESSYIQYVLHHLPSSPQVISLLAEGIRVSKNVVIVEELKGDNTDIVRAKLFDQEVNGRIHPGTPMPVYNYYSESDLRGFVEQVAGNVIFHSRVSPGDEENGYLETHVLVIAASIS